MSMNQKTGIMILSGIVAGVTSLVFTGSAMGLIGIKRAPNVTLDPTIAGQQPTPPVKKAAKNTDTEEQTVETDL